MNKKIATDLANLLIKLGKRTKSNYTLVGYLKERRLSGFHRWTDDRESKGAFLFKDKSGVAIWVLLLDWGQYQNGDFYIILFPKLKSLGPIVEIHDVQLQGKKAVFKWSYSPKKRDGLNLERKNYFAELFGSAEVLIPVPASTSDTESFIGELFKLADRRKKADELSIFQFPEEVAEDQGYSEGAIKQITVNSYERSPKARAECISHYGYACSVCELTMKDTYGKLGESFIHVHHIQPVSGIGEKGEVDPVKDLRPVCPNCHSMLHKKSPPLSIDKLKKIIEKTKTKNCRTTAS